MHYIENQNIIAILRNDYIAKLRTVDLIITVWEFAFCYGS